MFVCMCVQVRSLSFDLSGNYLSVAGTNVQYVVLDWIMYVLLLSNCDRVYLSKQWELLATFTGKRNCMIIASCFTVIRIVTDHTAPVNGVKFGNNASFVTSCGMDRTLKFYSN